jgi:3-dehydroquinate synthase
MHTLRVELGERSYPIYIGAGLLTRTDILRRHISGRQVLLVSNDTIAPLYLSKVQAMLGNLHHESIILPDGEQHKTLQTLELIFDGLLEKRFDRGCTLIALGGGVIGDITGFAAACYQRGVHYIQIPTTLLAQVDSSVGGKTAVNHCLGKNMIGAFYQPQCVIADTDTLQTLPDRELSAGIAEVIKYGLIRDLAFFEWLETHMDDLLERSPDALSYAIERSCQHKAEIVNLDEREAGLRALLNLGHTFAHAIEAGLGYGEWLHGEAVATGMVMAADLSTRLGWLAESDAGRISSLLLQARLPIRFPSSLGNPDLMRLMAVDKKVQDNRLRFILLESLGKGVISDDIDKEIIYATLDACRAANQHEALRS